ncbi:neuropeptide F receptor-like [Schistocerca gregaria]|uniref:neuropeptide F receptor-like n=1 Tax=Schistocerca gregaria TaxID=7010 RepID=UPI00211EA50B|nr:neuropeptide F receptor-like [Schistocerca gregaria]
MAEVPGVPGAVLLPTAVPSLPGVARNLSVHITRILNSSQVNPHIFDQYSRNRKLDDSAAFYGLIAAYSLLILIGAAGNSLVVCAVARKPAMRTARNMFIVNLAVSDLLLCLITMPLTLMEILTKYWPLGKQVFICKMLGALQATSIFVSTISITAIALDRYQVIVYPTRESLQKVGAIVILGCIWLVSLVLASPMFIWRALKNHDINLPDLPYISYCLEDWPVEHGRLYYSIFSLIVQYLLPIITVTVAYSRICHKLRYRYVNSSIANGKSGSGDAKASCSTHTSVRRKPKDDRRMKRTNSLLYSIALIFCISWLPLNIFNLVMDLWNPPVHDEQTMIICYAVCHMMGMSSACSNPLLYGWLNDNFRKEFHEIAAAVCPCVKMEVVRERVGSLRSSMTRRRHRRQDDAHSRPATGVVAGSTGRTSSRRSEGGGGGGSARGGGDCGSLAASLSRRSRGGSEEAADTEQTALTWRRGTDTTDNGLAQALAMRETTALTLDDK